MLYLNDQARPFAWPTLGPDPKNPPWWSKIMAERQVEVLSEKKKRSRKESVAKDVKK
jgi:siroheme synthase (precorrin-2 oxidase/ferrochelatase)